MSILTSRPKRNTLFLVVLGALIVSGTLAVCSRTSSSPEKQRIRQPAVAGSFYPADRMELDKMLDGFFAEAKRPDIRRPFPAIVVPHAGYIYSGQVAAQAYALLEERKTETVVIISPSHIDAFGFAAVYDGDAYATPLGTVPVDKTFAEKLAGMSPAIRLSARGHEVSRGRAEHAIEVQLPFLQRILGQFKVVPIIMGDQSYEASRALGVSLAKLMQGTDVLIVASTDLSHFHPYDEAVTLDHKTLKAIEEWDYLSLSRNFESRIWEACGGGGVVAAMIAAERLGARQARVLQYANSGDVTGDRDSVVGYGSVVFIDSSDAEEEETQGFSLREREKTELLAIARKGVETAVREGEFLELADTRLDSLNQERGAFVTLRIQGELRGCVGYSSAMKPLRQAVRDVAALAALRDIRFSPVTPEELPALEYEISVLSPLRRVFNVSEILVGRHGLVIKNGENEGLLLPQVATEQGWDRKTFLEQACVKAGLPPSASEDPDTDIFRFSALVFDE